MHVRLSRGAEMLGRFAAAALLAAFLAGCTPSAGVSGGDAGSFDVHPKDVAASDARTEPGEDGSAGSEVDAGTVSFRRDVFPVVKSKCALSGCHDMGTVTNHVTDFSTEERTYQRWLNGPGTDFCVPVGFASKRLVVPGRPEASLLIDKISSTREELCNDAHHPRMPPPPRARLPADELDHFRTWVAEGALRN
jgi:hypothetical protein